MCWLFLFCLQANMLIYCRSPPSIVLNFKKFKAIGENKMKYEPKKVFIIENDKYIEITYEEFLEYYNADEWYKNKYFIPIQGMLLEVSERDYTWHYKVIERNKYLKKLDIVHSLISMDNMDNGEIINSAKTEDIAVGIEREIMTNRLIESLSELTDDERDLIEEIYYNGLTERDLAAKYGISQAAVNKRKHRILEKLKKIIDF